MKFCAGSCAGCPSIIFLITAFPSIMIHPPLILRPIAILLGLPVCIVGPIPRPLQKRSAGAAHGILPVAVGAGIGPRVSWGAGVTSLAVFHASTLLIRWNRC